MSLELNLQFPDPEHVIVTFGTTITGALPFASPLTDDDRKEISWYLESYAAHYSTDVDDEHANRVRLQLPVWGEALFTAAFTNRGARRIFQRFQDAEEQSRDRPPSRDSSTGSFF